MALRLFTNKTYFLDNVQAQRPPTQYICAIMRRYIEGNIVHIASQLFFATNVLPQTSESLCRRQSSWQKQLILFAHLKRSKKSGIKWWSPRPDLNNIRIRHKSPHPRDFPYRISLKPFLVTNTSITYLSQSSLGNFPINHSSEALILGNPPHLLDLNARIPLNSFVNHLCQSAETIPMRSSVLECCLPQTLSRKLSLTLN